MKKFFIFFLIVMIISFITPSLFMWDILAENDKEIPIEEKETGREKTLENLINFSIPSKIKLLITENNKVIELNFEDYIKGVLIGEVPINYELEALKAQAIVARTYTIWKMKNNPSAHVGADMCDNINCCQAYKTKEYAFASWDDEKENEKWEKLETAVNSTSGKVITYQGEPISAFFHANSGGQTEDIIYVWGGEEVPYLKSVSGNEKNILQDIKSFSRKEFAELIKEQVSNYGEENETIEIVDYTGSGRVNHINIAGVILKATDLRKMIGVRSTNFRIEKSEDGTITFYTIGYGHGVGMSQEGANSMAQDGATCEEIIKHYYTGVEV